jgi:hypothetical protein
MIVLIRSLLQLQPRPVSTGEAHTAKITEHTQPSETPAADVKSEKTPQYVIYKGGGRFRQYNGSKRRSDMVALFDMKVAQTIIKF